MAQQREPEPTRLESAEEILKALEARKARKLQAATPRRPGGPPPPPRPAVSEAKRERPSQRPPMALLCILDDGPVDGKHDGEWIRLRTERILIGRTSGDVRIPHDGQISGEHAEIVREWSGNNWRWSLRDIGSTNGTFVRIGSTLLRHENEFLVGQGRYRFEVAAPAAGGLTAAYEPDAGGVTQMPQAGSGALRTMLASLVEVGPAGPLQRFPLSLPEYWIGREPREGAIVRGDDPYAEAQHARLYRDRSGQWHVANNGSLNGLWLRVKSIPLEKACQFRLGEQRFLFRVC